jgi:hypothetical protein
MVGMKKLLILSLFYSFVITGFCVYHFLAKEDNSENSLFKTKAQAYSDKCWNTAFSNNPTTTSDMKEAGIKANECLENIIKYEISLAFDGKTKIKIEKAFIESGENIEKYYWLFFTQNVYNTNSVGWSGSMNQLFNISKKAEFLKIFLADLLELKAKKENY